MSVSKPRFTIRLPLGNVEQEMTMLTSATRPEVVAVVPVEADVTLRPLSRSKSNFVAFECEQALTAISTTTSLKTVLDTTSIEWSNRALNNVIFKSI